MPESYVWRDITPHLKIAERHTIFFRSKSGVCAGFTFYTINDPLVPEICLRPEAGVDEEMRQKINGAIKAGRVISSDEMTIDDFFEKH